MLRRFLEIVPAIAMLAFTASAQSTAQVDPPPVDEAALVQRLFDMVKPSSGERAIILYDPTYYPGITTKLREALHAKGVNTYVIVEETPAMVATYIDNDVEHRKREDDVVATLLQVFKSSNIFYWMPVRGYADDLRWERLVAESSVRSVHFHWLLPFPGTMTPEAIISRSRDRERFALTIDYAEHSRRQERLSAALRGRKLRITTPGGTDLTIDVASDEWIHFGNGDASLARMATARSIRDRQIELPVGMFGFAPDAETVAGTIVAPAIYQAGTAVKNARFVMRSGRVTDMSGEGADWIRGRIGRIGPDGDKFAYLWFNTNPLSPTAGISVEIGSNWEGAEPRRRNRPIRMSRMSISLPDATITSGGRTIVRAGQFVWDEF